MKKREMKYVEKTLKNYSDKQVTKLDELKSLDKEARRGMRTEESVLKKDSKEEIINRVWGLDGDFLSNNLEVYVSFIRKKLNFVDADFTIESLRGIGYKLTKK